MTKIAIFSDVHANFQALEAVLAKIAEENCDVIACTGDIVGYGPQPKECINRIREMEIPCVLGNHDHYVTMIMDPRVDKLREDVQTTVKWTQSVLEMGELQWLAQLPKTIEYEELSLVHGCFGPKPWRYILNEDSVAKNFKYQTAKLAFCGHSHIPLIGFQIPKMQPFVSYLEKRKLPAAEKIIVNSGSVGQPRDHDPKASFVIYHLEEELLEPVKVEYDVEKTQALMREYKLPEKFSTRLAEGV